MQSGDKNNRFFHFSTIQRRQKNKIKLLKDDNGDWLDTETNIANGFSDYFQSLFSTDGARDWSDVLCHIYPRVTKEMNEELLKPVSMDEVKAAVFQLGALKSPGPDGFSRIFYQAYWEVVHAILVQASGNFLENCQLLECLNKTYIVLIPKVKKPEHFSQFRPISLCNFSYKIFSKILANRLRVILPDLISHNQAAFLQDRQIHDNIIIAHEVFHYLKMKRSGKDFGMGLKIDMNKAYDRVEWDFLGALLLKMGFDDRWVQLILTCLKSVSFSVLLNGKPGEFFKPSRGI